MVETRHNHGSVTPSVLVVGDVITDIAVRLGEEVVWGSDTRSAIQTRSGGSAANAAAWLATAGARVRFVGKVGDDVFAAFHRSELERVGVEALLRVDPDHPTGSIVVLIDLDGERTMLTDRGANLHLSPDDLTPDLFVGRDALYITGYSFFEPGVREAGLRAVKAAREAGMAVAVDPSSHPFLSEVGSDAFFRWTGGADFLFPNRDEARALAGEGEPEDMARRLARHYGQVVMTLGDRGALWSSTGELVALQGESVAVVDTTGAGDAFAAGFLASRLAGSSPRDALTVGAALAARVIAGVGARP